MPPLEVIWNAKVGEAAYLLRRFRQMKRDEGKKKGPPSGWERDELERWRQFLADAFGLEK
jgi:hypothetical protein